MLWDPFLIKKLIKSGVCGTHEQCTSVLFTADRVNSCGLGELKKKKKRRKKTQTGKRPIQTAPKYGEEKIK